MINRVDKINLTDSYGNKWALNLIQNFLSDDIDDETFDKAIGPPARLGSNEMKAFWWDLEYSQKRYNHEMKVRLKAMIGSNNASLRILKKGLDENNPFPYKYILWKTFAPLAWFNFKVSK